MKLIIAEKPSLARNIIAAIGSNKFQKQDGYYECSDYIVTFAYGHLFGLKDLEEYNPNYDPDEKTSWTLEGLPFRPHEFLFKLRPDPKTHKVDPGVKKQFQTIKNLCARKDVECVINAGDADREGEIIVRIILDQAGNQKPVWRLWMPDQTPDTIRAELRAVKRGENYDNLANEGYARTYIDWLYGINLTRYASLKSGTLLRVGRVIVPIVKAIYDRDMAIKNFVPKKYLGLASKAETNGEVIELNSKRTFALNDRDRANALADTYNQTGAVVKSIDKKKTPLQAGKLYSLSKLQGVLGKKFKMSPKESLAIVQDLYEKGYISYPRTNSEYLATTQRDSINAILEKLKDYGYKVCPKDLKRSIYDDSKIESHSALTPTNKLAKKEDLSEKEWQVYSTILNRFLAVFCSEDCIVDRTTIEIQVGDMETFKLKGDVFISKGWMQYDDNGKSDKILPPLAVGDIVNVDFQVADRETKPPAHYTVDSLNKYLKNPFKQEKKAASLSDDEDDAEDEAIEPATVEDLDADREEYEAIFEGVELGTEATRTGIIETAINSKYIALKNNKYTILPDGIFLIETLHKLHIDMGKEKTAELGRALKMVYRGELSVEDSVTKAFIEVRQFFTAGFDVTIDQADRPQGAAGESLGKCPKCGGNIVERDKLFGCDNKNCSFAIWKDNKLLQSIGWKAVTKQMVKSMLDGRKVLLKGCRSVKSGKYFDCFLIPDFTGEHVSFSIEYPEAEDVAIGTCPKCGGFIIEREKLFGCDNKDCSFAIWKDNKLLQSIGKTLNASLVRSLLKKEKVLLKGCKSAKSGNTFDCFLVPDVNGEHVSFSIEYPDAEDLSLGKCPKCGSPVVEREKLFGCSSKECRFAIWKDDKFFQSIGRKPNSAIVKQLLSKKQVNLKDCTSQKSGKKFDCCVYVDFSGQWPKYDMQFLNKRK